MNYQDLILIAFVFSLFSCSDDESFSVECIPDNLQNGVIALYPFSNGSLADASGNGNDLDNNTTAKPGFDRQGNAQCAFEFDNLPISSEFLSTENTSFLDGLNELSISLWYQPQDSSRAIGAFEVLISRDEGPHCPDTYGQWSIGLYDCRKAVFGYKNSVWDEHTPGNSCEMESDALTGHWHHLAVTYNHSGNTLKLYRNGVLKSTKTGIADCGMVPTVEDIGDLFLGRDYTGRMDDVLIYERELTAAEVSQLSELEPCCD